MSPTFRPRLLALAALAACAIHPALAAPVVYAGDDATADFMVPPSGASALAKAEFLAQLTQGSVEEGFESFTRGNGGPLPIFGERATLTMGGTGTGRTESREEDEQGNKPGRFNTTAGGSVWWQSSGTFLVDFGGKQVAGFGFYGTDWSDYGGSLSLELLDDGAVLETLVVKQGAVGQVKAAPDAVSTNGSLSFFGFTDSARSYDAIRFVITQSGTTTDVLGFDDFVLGAVAPGGALPEPGTLALAGLSLAGLALAGRRQRR